MTADVHWRCVAFDALHVRELDAIYAARQQVFVIEQQCLYLDVDGADVRSHHVSAWNGPGIDAALLAYARIVAPGIKYVEPAIGRVLTTASARGRGLGRALIARAVEACRQLYPDAAIRISAQSHLEALYGSFGFVAHGERYLEDGIEHTEMLLAAGG